MALHQRSPSSIHAAWDGHTLTAVLRLQASRQSRAEVAAIAASIMDVHDGMQTGQQTEGVVLQARLYPPLERYVGRSDSTNPCETFISCLVQLIGYKATLSMTSKFVQRVVYLTELKLCPDPVRGFWYTYAQLYRIAYHHSTLTWSLVGDGDNH